jgi:hypothetical protein
MVVDARPQQGVISVTARVQAFMEKTVLNGSLQVCSRRYGHERLFVWVCHLDPCAPNPCRNDGKCTWDGLTMDCICTAGYTGPFCQVSLGRLSSFDRVRP